jgi:hypothetical protein
VSYVTSPRQTETAAKPAVPVHIAGPVERALRGSGTEQRCLRCDRILWTPSMTGTPFVVGDRVIAIVVADAPVWVAIGARKLRRNETACRSDDL